MQNQNETEYPFVEMSDAQALIESLDSLAEALDGVAQGLWGVVGGLKQVILPDAEEKPQELPYSKRVLQAALDFLGESDTSIQSTAYTYSVDPEDLRNALRAAVALRGGG